VLHATQAPERLQRGNTTRVQRQLLHVYATFNASQTHNIWRILYAKLYHPRTDPIQASEPAKITFQYKLLQIAELNQTLE
jgi:hypothetical protein